MENFILKSFDVLLKLKCLSQFGRNQLKFWWCNFRSIRQHFPIICRQQSTIAFIFFTRGVTSTALPLFLCPLSSPCWHQHDSVTSLLNQINFFVQYWPILIFFWHYIAIYRCVCVVKERKKRRNPIYTILLYIYIQIQYGIQLLLYALHLYGTICRIVTRRSGWDEGFDWFTLKMSSLNILCKTEIGNSQFLRSQTKILMMQLSTNKTTHLRLVVTS